MCKNLIGKTKWMYSLIEHDDLLGTGSTIWDKASVDIREYWWRACLQ